MPAGTFFVFVAAGLLLAGLADAAFPYFFFSVNYFSFLAGNYFSCRFSLRFLAGCATTQQAGG
ncbi:hypothetical protein [Bradyrhizobium sp. S69]|uniref:hypothetical protein n=1 Tax=Bradyrhizobium sp. S69 TaxID=1641856 RepID=UPI00131D8F02|nr:hypothetical protein [Bradyrhizobium sp. S69]